MAGPNTTTDRVATISRREPRLAARLLQTANSAAFNPAGKPLTDFALGPSHAWDTRWYMAGTAMSYAVQQMKASPALRSIAQPLHELWESAQPTAASISRIVAGRTKVSADEAFLPHRPAARDRRDLLHHGWRKRGYPSPALRWGPHIPGSIY